MTTVMRGAKARDIEAHELYEEIKALLPDECHLVWVEPDDRLRPEQIAAHFKTADQQNEVENDILDTFFDYRRERALEEIQSAYEATGRDDGWGYVGLLLESADLLDELRCIVEDRDQSDPYGDLLNSTPPELFRYDLGFEGETWIADEGHQLVSEIVDHLVMECGFEGDISNLYADVRELVSNAIQVNGKLQIIFHERPSALINPCNQVHWGNRSVMDFTVTITDPPLLLIDTMSGAGHEVALKGKLRMPFFVERVILDSWDGGYGWDDACGLYKPAYNSDFTIHDATSNSDKP